MNKHLIDHLRRAYNLSVEVIILREPLLDVQFDSHYTSFSSSHVFIEKPFSVFHGR